MNSIDNNNEKLSLNTKQFQTLVIKLSFLVQSIETMALRFCFSIDLNS